MSIRQISVVLIMMVLSLRNCDGFQCYICNWSPNINNRTDQCTSANFNEITVNVFNGCIHGCEVVTVFEANGGIYNFYRNCLMKGKKVLDECLVETKNGRKTRSCRCASHYCNSSSLVQFSWLLPIAFILTTSTRIPHLLSFE